jgi:LysM repeat protein
MEETATEKTMKEVEAKMAIPEKEESPKKSSNLQSFYLVVIMIVVIGAAIVFSNYITSKTIGDSIKGVISQQVKTEIVPIIKQSIPKQTFDQTKLISDVKIAVKEAVKETIKEKIIETPFHIVAKDETLWGISRYYKVDLKALEKINEDILKTTNGIIYPGMGLRLP